MGSRVGWTPTDLLVASYQDIDAQRKDFELLVEETSSLAARHDQPGAALGSVLVEALVPGTSHGPPILCGADEPRPAMTSADAGLNPAMDATKREASGAGIVL